MSLGVRLLLFWRHSNPLKQWQTVCYWQWHTTEDLHPQQWCWRSDCADSQMPFVVCCMNGLTDSQLCRKCGAEDETSAYILCQCEALASIRQAHLGSFFLEPEDVKSQTLGAIWRFSKVAGLPWKMVGAQRAGIKGLGASGLRAPNPYTNQSINQCCMNYKRHN
jgi:hypothetical protein